MGKAKAQQQYKARQPEPGSQPAPDVAKAAPKIDNRDRQPNRNQQTRRPDQPPESPAARIERIAKEALELRKSEYERAVHNQEVIQDLIDVIKIKTPAEQRALRDELQTLERDLKDALQYITKVEFEDRKSESWEQQIAVIQAIPEADRTPKQNEDLQLLFDSVNDFDHRMKLYNIGQPATNNKSENQAKQAPAPLIGSPEWRKEELQKQAAQELAKKARIADAITEKAQLYQRVADLHENLNDLPQHPLIIKEIQKLEARISALDKIIPPDPATAKTIIPGQMPAPAPEKGSLAWKQAEAQKAATELLNIKDARNKLALEIVEHERHLRVLPSPALRSLISEKKAELANIDKKITAEAKVDQVTPQKITLKPTYTTRELAEQEVNEDYAFTTQSIEEARKQLTILDARLAAQDVSTTVGKRNSAELTKRRQEIEAAIAEHLPTPPDIRPEVQSRLARLEDIRYESRDLYNKSVAFQGDKAAAATAAAEIVKLNKQITTKSTPIFKTIQKAYNELTDLQRQELPPMPTSPDKGALDLNDWFTAWKDSEAGSGSKAKKELPFYKRIFAKTNQLALDDLLNLAESAGLADAVDTQNSLEAARRTWEAEVRQQQKYVADFSKEVDDVIKNGLPELPKNITADERAAWLPLVNEIANEIKDSAIPNQVNKETLKKWDAFYKAVGKQLDILNGKVETKEAKPDSTTVTVEEERKVEKDPILQINLEDQAVKATLDQYQNSLFEGTAAWEAAQLLRIKKSINKKYFMLRTRDIRRDTEEYSTEELEDAWNSLVEAMQEQDEDENEDED